jgi:dihydrodipicolinate synthase/N-acetylneuraminate lyase
MFVDGSPAGIKAALEAKSLISNNLRLPLVKVEKSLYNQIANLISELELVNTNK